MKSYRKSMFRLFPSMAATECAQFNDRRSADRLLHVSEEESLCRFDWTTTNTTTITTTTTTTTAKGRVNGLGTDFTLTPWSGKIYPGLLCQKNARTQPGSFRRKTSSSLDSNDAGSESSSSRAGYCLPAVKTATTDCREERGGSELSRHRLPTISSKIKSKNSNEDSSNSSFSSSLFPCHEGRSRSRVYVFRHLVDVRDYISDYSRQCSVRVMMKQPQGKKVNAAGVTVKDGVATSGTPCDPKCLSKKPPPPPPPQRQSRSPQESNFNPLPTLNTAGPKGPQGSSDTSTPSRNPRPTTTSDCNSNKGAKSENIPESPYPDSYAVLGHGSFNSVSGFRTVYSSLAEPDHAPTQARGKPRGRSWETKTKPVTLKYTRGPEKRRPEPGSVYGVPLTLPSVPGQRRSDGVVARSANSPQVGSLMQSLRKKGAAVRRRKSYPTSGVAKTAAAVETAEDGKAAAVVVARAASPGQQTTAAVKPVQLATATGVTTAPRKAENTTATKAGFVKITTTTTTGVKTTKGKPLEKPTSVGTVAGPRKSSSTTTSSTSTILTPAAAATCAKTEETNDAPYTSVPPRNGVGSTTHLFPDSSLTNRQDEQSRLELQFHGGRYNATFTLAPPTRGPCSGSRSAGKDPSLSPPPSLAEKQQQQQQGEKGRRSAWHGDPSPSTPPALPPPPLPASSSREQQNHHHQHPAGLGLRKNSHSPGSGSQYYSGINLKMLLSPPPPPPLPPPQQSRDREVFRIRVLAVEEGRSGGGDGDDGGDSGSVTASGESKTLTACPR